MNEGAKPVEESEKTKKTNEYANLCAKIGETILILEMSDAELPKLKAKAIGLLAEIKGMK